MVRPRFHRPALPGSALVIAALLIVHLTAGPAQAIYQAESGWLDLGGSFRTLVGIIDDSGQDAPLDGAPSTDPYNETLLRLTATGQPTDSLGYEIHLVQSYTYLPASSSWLGGALSGTGEMYRAFDLTWTMAEEDDYQAYLYLDRAAAKISFSRADLTVGRQAITFGQAYFWNPLDVFSPFSPDQFDRDYKAGVDAVRLDVPWGDFSGLSLVYAAGRRRDLAGGSANNDFADVDWYGSALLARARTNFHDWDLTAQGGKIYGGWQIGAGFSGDVSGLSFRGEAAYFWSQEDAPAPAGVGGNLLEDYFTGVIGLGKRFESSLEFSVEYLFNGLDGDNNQTLGLYRTALGLTRNWSRHLIGLLVQYELTPLVRCQGLVIQSLTDSSTLIQPIFTISAGDNSELIFGAAIALGDQPKRVGRFNLPQSEFGSYSQTVFVQYKWYF